MSKARKEPPICPACMAYTASEGGDGRCERCTREDRHPEDLEPMEGEVLPATLHPIIEETMKQQLIKHKGDRFKLAAEVDGRIRGNARHFVQFGIDLMMMRDGQLYRDLPGCAAMSFEEYVGSVEELSVRYARDVIQSSLVYQAIERGEPGVPPSALPATEKHCRALIDAGRPSFKLEEREALNTKGERQVVKQPVEVANPDKLTKDWEKVVKSYDTYCKRFTKENPGKRPKKISYTFIRQQFPGGQDMSKSLDHSPYSTLGRQVAKLHQTMRAIRDKYKSNWPKLFEAEGWGEDHFEALGGRMFDLRTELDQWMEVMGHE